MKPGLPRRAPWRQRLLVYAYLAASLGLVGLAARVYMHPGDYPFCVLPQVGSSLCTLYILLSSLALVAVGPLEGSRLATAAALLSLLTLSFSLSAGSRLVELLPAAAHASIALVGVAAAAATRTPFGALLAARQVYDALQPWSSIALDALVGGLAARLGPEQAGALMQVERLLSAVLRPAPLLLLTALPLYVEALLEYRAAVRSGGRRVEPGRARQQRAQVGGGSGGGGRQGLQGRRLQHQPRKPRGAAPRPASHAAAGQALGPACRGFRFSDLSDPERSRELLERCLVGRTVYGYTVERLLGRGGFGAVFKAYKEVGSRRIDAALKVMLPPVPGGDRVTARRLDAYLEDLNRETGNLIALSEKSPYIVRLKGVHVDLDVVREAIRYGDLEAYMANPPSIVMEYMAGGSLLDLMERARVEGLTRRRGEWLRIVAAVAAAVAEALDAIHSSGYVHSDVKPENILFTGPPPREPGSLLRGLLSALRQPEKARIVPKLSDLGSAVRAGEEAVQFTLAYSDYPYRLYTVLASSDQRGALEKLRLSGALRASPANDVFSLGMSIIDALLAGKRREERRQILMRIAGVDPSTGRRVLDRSLVETVTRRVEPLTGLLLAMLDPDPNRRPAAGRVARCLRCLAETPLDAWSRRCTAACPARP